MMVEHVVGSVDVEGILSAADAEVWSPLSVVTINKDVDMDVISSVINPIQDPGN